MGGLLYEISGLRQVYRTRTVLHIDRLEIPRGAIVGVIGPNGGGKSTLLKLIGFVEKPSAGKIVFKGKPAEPFTPQVRRQVTLMPQEPFLLKRTVFNNVAYGLSVRKDTDKIKERVHEALAWVGLNGRDFAGRPWYALSGGEAQRVALASRLILKPDVLLLDEPTANVDAMSSQLIKDAALKARQDRGTTLIIASHDWQWLHEVADSTLHLFKGRLSGTGRETILFGPWERTEQGSWGKTLADEQCLRVPQPPAADAAAVIEDIRVVNSDDTRAFDSTASTLSGTITRLALEKASGDVRASILVSGLPFTGVLPQRQIREQGLYPGLRVRLFYDWSCIRWI